MDNQPIDVVDPDVPEFFGMITMFLQQYGWPLLIGSILLYTIYSKIKGYLNWRSVYNKDRVARLDKERMKKREEQLKNWSQTASQNFQEDTTKKNEEKVKKIFQKNPRAQTRATMDTDSITYYRPSLSERYANCRT